MTKKTQRKNRTKPAGSSDKEFAEYLDKIRQCIASRAARQMVDSATKLGVHRARAELIAPIIKQLTDTAMNNNGRQTLLGNSAAQIVLACLAEAGYVPQDEHASTKAIKPDTSWSGVPGDDASSYRNGCDEKAPATKAA